MTVPYFTVVLRKGYGLGAMAMAIPLSLGCAIFTAEIASTRLQGVLKPAIELLADLPAGAARDALERDLRVHADGLA